jgi:signal transduction histidine kinase/FixJ family two-component response regulator/sensor domain CHASE-containing protein
LLGFGESAAFWTGTAFTADNVLLDSAVIRVPATCRARLPPVWIFAVLAGGVVLSLALFFTIRGWERREVEKRAADLAREQAEKLEVSILRSMEVLHSIASLQASDGQIGRVQFGRFVEQALARQPELQALSWNPAIPGAQRTALEAAAVADGLPDFQIREFDAQGRLQPAATRAEYVPVYYIEPFARNSTALGYDLGSDPERLATISEARDTGRPVATAPIRLAQGPENQAGLLVLQPVYSGAVPVEIAERRRQLAGFAVAVFRVNDLVGRSFAELTKEGITAWLSDELQSGRQLYSNADPRGDVPAKQAAVIRLSIAGRRWTMRFSPTQKFIAAESRGQAWVVLAGGLAFTLLTTAYLLRDWRQAREIAAANAALQEEVRVRQRAEAAAAAANQAKSDFLASMSHEIRTPLNAILGYTQLMQRDANLPPDQRDAVAGINASGRHLLGMINEILDLSKIEAGRMELNATDFSLKSLADGLVATFRPVCARKKIAFRLEIDGGGLARVRGDEGKLRQVLINLAGNATKFTLMGGVHVNFKPAAAGRWLFEVIDTGLGIPEAEREDIFKPFHQGSGAQHQGGTGLGLAIAQRQVELLGGRLELQSERGVGSRFFFHIPLAPAAAGREELPGRQVQRLAPGCRVRALVVDDNPENRAVLRGLLTGVGCEVALAESGEEALAQTPVWRPDVIFLDLLLPGLSGVETARQLLQGPASGSRKIVAHTASALARHQDEARAAGCVDFIAKPFHSDRLYECLERHAGARFEYAEPPREHEARPSLDHRRIEVPEELCARLMVAAELHSATVLKACVQELRQRGPETALLAEEIRFLMRSYDMDGIIGLLGGTAVAVKAGA